MAYKTIELKAAADTYQQSPKKSQFYKGFSSVDDANLGSRLYDFDLIKQDILNHFRTKKGERVMNPNFGSIIWDLLMEPMTPQVKTALTDDIQQICNNDPRVTPTRINLIEQTNGYILEITLLMKGTDQSSNLKLSFDQRIGLQVVQ